jgi:hypothetical protein
VQLEASESFIISVSNATQVVVYLFRKGFHLVGVMIACDNL